MIKTNRLIELFYSRGRIGLKIRVDFRAETFRTRELSIANIFAHVHAAEERSSRVPAPPIDDR